MKAVFLGYNPPNSTERAPREGFTIGQTYDVVVQCESVSVTDDDGVWRSRPLRDFDVQYRVGTGSWSKSRNDTMANSITLWNRSRGVTYGLRVRGTDNRGNVGKWSAEVRVTVP